MADVAVLKETLRRNSEEINRTWLERQQKDGSLRGGLLKPGELEQQTREFLAAMSEALEGGSDVENVATSKAWVGARDFLSALSRSRARQGFTPMETATFVFSLKESVFDALRSDLSKDPSKLADATWSTTQILDQLGLATMDTYQKSREEIIARQQQELTELSTPVIQLWEGILALPLIGTLDSARTQVVMENLLQAIVETRSSIAIIDITGVPVVDTVVAQHLLKTISAARLMGAECIISGIRPQIAQTIVHLGVEIADVITKATLADALAVALSRSGLAIRKKI